MLYGHIETAGERIDHMLRARALQDDTGGFQAFIPLAFHPDNNQMRKLPAPSAVETLRVHAVARLMLDNIPHIKAFWIATGIQTAQLALWYGADDLDGTVQEERIYHMAGSPTPTAMSTSEIRRLIRAAGREPVERDTLYNVIRDQKRPTTSERRPSRSPPSESPPLPACRTGRLRRAMSDVRVRGPIPSRSRNLSRTDPKTERGREPESRSEPPNRRTRHRSEVHVRLRISLHAWTSIC